MIPLGPAPRFLIARLSAIGDCIHTMPVACALRARFPDAHIAWITQPGPATLLAGHAALDTIQPLDRGYLRSPQQLARVRRRLRAAKYDVVIDCQSLTKSALLGWLSGARVRIGFSRGQGRELAPWLNNHCVVPRQEHVVPRYLELLRPLGITDAGVRFGVPTFPDARAELTGLPGRFALLNPGAGWHSKRWPHHRYSEIAQHLAQEHTLPSVVLWAGPQERAWAEEIVLHAGGSAQLAPPTSLPALAELCRQAVLFVGSDTGPLHLAAACDTPCVAMYGPTKISVCGPYGSGHEALQVRYQSGNSAARRGHDNRAMRAISVGTVCLACDRILLDGVREQAA